MKLNIGAGRKTKEGYKQLDIVAFPDIDYVCTAWEIPVVDGVVEEIYARHFLEHVTPEEADKTLVEWRRVLKNGGFVHIILPDLSYHCRQMFWDGNAKISKRFGRAVSNLDHAMHSIYGWAPGAMSHKWGYTATTLETLLLKHGFSRLKFDTGCEWDLNVTAYKGESEAPTPERK